MTTTTLTPEQHARHKASTCRQVGGNDGRQYALIVNGRALYQGMTRTEAKWRRDRYVSAGTL